jgi:hypothetical protein
LVLPLELDINPKLVQNMKLAVFTGIGTENVRTFPFAIAWRGA